MYIKGLSFLNEKHFAFSFFTYFCTKTKNRHVLMRKTLLLFAAFFTTTMTVWSDEPVAKKWYLSMLPKIKTEVKPMLTTRWGQGAPYNNSCPTAPSSSEHCLTGCVATAMAQVMKYYQYPDKGKGNVTYCYIGEDGKQHNV